MKLSVISDSLLQKFYLKDLSNNILDIDLDTDQNLKSGWYELCIEYVDTKIEISDILINDSSISHMIYTGYYTDGNGTIHQPATAVWDTGGVFSIWIHTELGIMYQRVYEAIRNGDFGKNLFDNYILTVDRPFVTKNIWPDHIRSFYANAHGPQWWYNNNKYTPWKYCDLPDYDTDELLRELEPLTIHHSTRKNGNYCIKQIKEYASDLPFIEIQDIPSALVRDFVSNVGYKRIIDISVQTLSPGTYIDIHRDDHYKRKAYPYMRGCKKLYWAVKAHKGVYFKQGRSGILPLDKPLLLNTIEHAHSVIHEGDQVRTSILVYGELD
jgi:hypothetical protein